MKTVNCELTRDEILIICQALVHLHSSNGEYLQWKKDEFSQEQIPILMKKIVDINDKMHKLTPPHEPTIPQRHYDEMD